MKGPAGATIAGVEPASLPRSPVVERALEIAQRAHSEQRRESDCAPFLEHPVAVAGLLAEAGFSEEVVAAGLLHDVVEDTDLDPSTLAAALGARVAGLVEAMSEDESIDSYPERKAAHRDRIAGAGRDAAAIFAADKLAKARELRQALADDPDGVESRSQQPLERKLDHYRRSLEMLREAHGDLPWLDVLASELDALERARAAGAGP